MRTLTLLFSLLFFLQPASWAAGMPTSATAETHCQNERQANQQLAQGQSQAQTDSAHQHKTAFMADCQADCPAGCASPISLTPSMSFTLLQQNLVVARSTPLLTFHSYTESPEIRPPLT